MRMIWLIRQSSEDWWKILSGHWRSRSPTRWLTGTFRKLTRTTAEEFHSMSTWNSSKNTIEHSVTWFYVLSEPLSLIFCIHLANDSIDWLNRFDDWWNKFFKRKDENLISFWFGWGDCARGKELFGFGLVCSSYRDCFKTYCYQTRN